MHAKTGGSGGQAGIALRGSGDFHAWGDSNLYVRRQKDAIVLTIEHRAAAAPDPLRLQLVADDGGGAHLQTADAAVDEGTAGAPSRDLELDRLVLEKLATAKMPVTRAQLRAELRVRNERLGDTLLRLTTCGALIRDGDHWRVPVPIP